MAIAYKVGDSDTRPWGTWEVLAVGDAYIVKRIVVNPHQRLSLQSHNYRSEHWVIVTGNGVATLADKVIEAQQNSHIFIQPHQKHRMENSSDTPLVFIEIQAGDTLDESDIIRYQDDYGRVKNCWSGKDCGCDM